MRLPRPSLLTQILVALLLVGLVPLAAAAYYLIELNRDALSDQVLHTHAVAASTAAARVADHVGMRVDLARALAADPELAAAPRSAATTGRLARLLEAYPDLAAVVIADPAGDEAVRVQRSEDATAAGRALAARAAAAPVALATVDGASWLLTEAALDGRRGRVRLVWRGDGLAEALDPFAIGEQAELALVGPAGVVAGAPGALAGLPAALLDTARSGRVTGAVPFATPAGDEALAAFDAVSGTPWSVVSRQPRTVAERAAVRMRRAALAAIAVALLFTLLLTLGAYRFLVRPLRRVVGLQRSLAGLRDEPAAGNEIGQLKESFAALERRLRDRRAVEEVFLGRYQVLDVLGEGAMGIVFRGWDPKLERPVALKTVHLDGRLLDDRRGELSTRLVNEAVTAARFSHPNIVSIYDVEDASEAAFIAMELVDGVSLERYLWMHGPLTPGQTARLGAEISRALAAAHERGIVHHDVKPANVLIGVDGSVKVTDFGISRAVTSLAEGDAVFGTPGYLPPETLRGEGYDPRSDLFALGALLYHCLAGEGPFKAPTVRESVLATIGRQIDPPAGTPAHLGALLLQLLAKNADERPVDAAAVAARLEQMGHEWSGDWPLVPRTAETAAAGGGGPEFSPAPGTAWVHTQHTGP